VTRANYLNLFLLVFASCQQTFSRKDLLDYTFDAKNGLYKMEDNNGILIEVIYKPNQLIAEQEIKGRNLKKSQIDSIKNYFHDFDYFLLRLSRNKHEIENAYAQDPVKFIDVNNYLSFEIGKDVYLVNNEDTVRATDFIHTRTFGSSPSSDILFAFKCESSDRSGEINFIFNDTKFDTGLNEFAYANSDLKSVSSINLTEKPL
jgi:hypothetical protein